MTAASRAAPGAPPLDPELERLLRRMRLPYIRNAAPELLATAKAQRWDPAEVLKALLVEEVSGRDRSALATRRARPGSPPARPSPPGTRTVVHPGTDPAGAAHPGMGPPAGEPGRVRTRPAPARRSCWKPSVSKPSRPGCTSPGSASKRSASWCAATAPTTPSPRPSPGSCAQIWSSSTTSACSPVGARRRRRPLPPRRRRLRETLHRDQLQPAPRRVRRADAQDPRHRHRRPAAAPRPRLSDQRRQRPPVPSHAPARG